MSGLIFDIKHFAIHDGPGLRTTIFLKGCPLQCWWCHNPESISVNPQQINITRKIGSNQFIEKKTIGNYMSADQVMKEIEKDRVFYEESDGGVTFSGGEPLFQFDFLLEIVKDCKEKNIHVCLDTSGYAKSGKLKTIIPLADLFLFDLKLLNDELHLKYTGVSNKLILENLDVILNSKKEVIIRYPLIPGINNSDEQLTDLHRFLENRVKEIHFLPYHSIARHKYHQLGIVDKLGNLKTIPEESLATIKEKFENLNYAIKIGG